jgi:hypothetical protein
VEVPFRGYRLSVPPAESRASEGDRIQPEACAETSHEQQSKNEAGGAAARSRHFAAQRTQRFRETNAPAEIAAQMIGRDWWMEILLAGAPRKR